MTVALVGWRSEVDPDTQTARFVPDLAVGYLGRWHVIDFRPDATVASGVCVVACDSTALKPGALVLADDPSDASKQSRAIVNALGNRLNVTIQADTLDSVLLELLTVHANDQRVDRWNRLRPKAGRHEIWLGEKIVDIPVVSGGAVYTDAFTRADSTDLGADWTQISPAQMEIVSNTVQNVSGSGTGGNFRWNADLNTNDNYTKAKSARDSGVSTNFWGVNCRFDSATTTCYQYRVDTFQAGVVNKVVSGSVTALTSSTSSGVDFNVGVVAYIEVYGSSIVTKVNTTTHHTVTDTSILTGLRGGLYLAANGSRRVGWDDFETGDLPGVLIRQTITARQGVYRAATR